MQGFRLVSFSVFARGVSEKGESWDMESYQISGFWKPSHFTSGNHLNTTECFVLNYSGQTEHLLFAY